MDSRQRVYKTDSIDLTTYLSTKGYSVNVTCQPGDTRATFEVEQKPSLFTDIADYESGGTAPAKKLLNSRSYLYRQASAVVRGAR